MSTIGERLRAERDRLGMNQTDFAALGGVAKRAQINYESGERFPDADYLSRIAAAGCDVLFILTNQRREAAASLNVDLLAAALEAVERATARAKAKLNARKKASVTSIVYADASTRAGTVDADAVARYLKLAE